MMMWDAFYDFWNRQFDRFERVICFFRGHQWCEITFEKDVKVVVCMFCLKKEYEPATVHTPNEIEKLDRGWEDES